MVTRRTSAGGVVVNPHNNVAVVHQFGTSYSLPKGTVRPDEDLTVAARRKIRDETGLDRLYFVKRLGSYARPGIRDPDIEIHITMYHFMTPYTGPLKPLNPEHPSAIWVEMDNVADILSHPVDKEFFSRIIREL